MLCPNCQAEVREGAAFCGSCGATIAPAAAGVTEPLPQPTAPMPGPDAAAQAAYEAELAEYERQKAAYEQAQYAQQVADYERQKAAYDQQAYAQQPGAYPQAGYGAPAQAAPPKKKTGLVVAIVIILILLLVGCGVGGFFVYKAWDDNKDVVPEITDTDTDTGDTDIDAGDTDTGNALDSYDTAEEAVMAQLEASGVGDWVYQLTEEGDGYAYYWAGPPNSEFVDEMYLEQNADGTWSVIEVNSIDMGGDTSGGTSAGDEAIWVVDLHLWYVQSDMGLEAQSLTVDPFHADSASAQVSAGGLDYYSVDGYSEEADGTFWVQTTQSWYGNVEGWEYWVVPTEAGYMIADIRYME